MRSDSKRSRFIKLFFGLLTGQAAAIAVLPILYWLSVSNGVIGELRQFQACLALIAIFLSAQLETFLTAAKTEEEAKFIGSSAKLFTVFSSSLLLIPATFFFSHLGTLCVLAASSESWTRINRFISAREKTVRPVTISRLSFGLTNLCLQPLAALAHSAASVFMAIDTMSRFASATISQLLLNTTKTTPTVLTSNRSPADSFSRGGIRNNFIKRGSLLLSLGAPLTISQGCAFWCNIIPAVLLPELFDDSVAGKWAIAYAVTMLPCLLIGQSVTHVFLGELSGSITKQILPILRKTLLFLSCSAALIAIFSVYVTPQILRLIFPNRNEIPPIYFLCAALITGGNLIGGPLSNLLIRYRRIRLKMYLHIIFTCLLSTALVMPAIIDGEPITAILSYAIALAFSEFITVCVVFFVAKDKGKKHGEIRTDTVQPLAA